MRRWWTPLWLSSLAACAPGPAVEAVELDLKVAGSEVSAPFDGRDGARITLQTADLAFGPLYLCRSRQAGELCETAALDWTESTVVDALDPAPRQAGTLQGLSGRVQSFMYDLGLHSLLTQPRPLVLDAAQQLGGYSVILQGEAVLSGRILPFVFEVAVATGKDSTQGVPVASSTVNDDFDHEVTSDTEALTVRFDPRPWLRDVRFEQFIDERSCADAEPPSTVCAGDLWQQCDGMGGVTAERDCAALDRVCVIDQGCRAAFTSPEGSQAARAVRSALVSGQHPVFRWTP